MTQKPYKIEVTAASSEVAEQVLYAINHEVALNQKLDSTNVHISVSSPESQPDNLISDSGAQLDLLGGKR